jgi:hypothetical protein
MKILYHDRAKTASNFCVGNPYHQGRIMLTVVPMGLDDRACPLRHLLQCGNFPGGA